MQAWPRAVPVSDLVWLEAVVAEAFPKQCAQALKRDLFRIKQHLHALCVPCRA